MDANLPSESNEPSKGLNLLNQAIDGFNRLNAKHAAQIADLEEQLRAERQSSAQIVPLLEQLISELEKLAPAPIQESSDAEASPLDAAEGTTQPQITTFGDQTWQP